MAAFTTFVEVKVIGAVKDIQAIQNVFAGMRMNDIEQNHKSKSVCCVYQLFEFFRKTIARAGSEKVGNLVPECWKQDRIASAIK